VKLDARGSIIPEMLSANIDDVVAWTFDKYRQNDVYMLSNDSVSYSVKKGKKGGKKYEVNEGFELDANTLAGEIMKPRSVQ